MVRAFPQWQKIMKKGPTTISKSPYIFAACRPLPSFNMVGVTLGSVKDMTVTEKETVTGDLRRGNGIASSIIYTLILPSKVSYT